MKIYREDFTEDTVAIGSDDNGVFYITRAMTTAQIIAATIEGQTNYQVSKVELIPYGTSTGYKMRVLGLSDMRMILPYLSGYEIVSAM